ncbi:hypothetical protein, partial [Cysteiniphilum sp. SYW-8]|uniref:hypothetical protein n=1 Tax=Cysteiniphilum sp. SYW-8 TaxID=2610890 RepID=UPI001CD05A36
QCVSPNLILASPIILFGMDVAFAQLFLHIKLGRFPNGQFTVLAVLAVYAFVISSLFILNSLVRHVKK